MPPYDSFVYPTLEVEPGEYVRLLWHEERLTTEYYWVVVPGSIYADRFVTWCGPWSHGINEERSKVHLFNINHNVRYWLSRYAHMIAPMSGHNPPPFYLHTQMKDNMVRWGMKKMKGFAAHALAQCGERDLEDSRVMFSTLGYGPREWTLEYLKSLEHRDYMGSYGMRLAIGAITEADCRHGGPWYQAMERLPYREPLTAGQKRMAIHAPGGISFAIMDSVVTKKNNIPFGLPRDRQAWYLADACMAHYRREHGGAGLAAIQRSSLYNIHKAMRLMADYMGLGQLRKKDNVRTAANNIADCPPARCDTVLDWTRRSIRWHEELREAREERWRQWDIEQAKRQELLDRAKFPELTRELPDGFRYLDSLAAYTQEGREMEHCVANYANGGILGHHFMFHYGPDGDGATVMVAPDGSVVQNLGRRNRQNADTARAGRIMEAWARGGRFYDPESVQEVAY